MGTDVGLIREVRLWVQWARQAGGPWLPADEPASVNWDLKERSSGMRGSPAGGGQTLQAGAQRAADCRRCGLCATRQQTVYGEGPARPRLVVVGEAPGADEDASGRPFVGAAGRLLTRMLAAIGLDRSEVYICNLLKCRPPENRSPRPDEVASCKPFLVEQLEALQPELILALGSPASRELLQTERGIMSLRGRITRSRQGWLVLPTYHPAYLLRRPAAKREAWADLLQVAAHLALEVPVQPARDPSQGEDAASGAQPAGGQADDASS